VIKIITTALIALAVSTLHAQKFSDTLSRKDAFLRFNPLGLIDANDMNFSIGAEKRIGDKFSVALDVAYIFYSDFFDDEGNTKGFIIRPAARFFPGGGKFFLETELHYKQSTHRLWDWIGRDAVNNVPAYEQLLSVRLRKKVWGAHIKVGRLIPVTNRLWFELYLGIGPHFRTYQIVDHPEMVYQVNHFFNTVFTGDTEKLVALPAGFRLLYRISER
jgi:hypothetical protein